MNNMIRQDKHDFCFWAKVKGIENDVLMAKSADQKHHFGIVLHEWLNKEELSRLPNEIRYSISPCFTFSTTEEVEFVESAYGFKQTSDFSEFSTYYRYGFFINSIRVVPYPDFLMQAPVNNIFWHREPRHLFYRFQTPIFQNPILVLMTGYSPEQWQYLILRKWLTENEQIRYCIKKDMVYLELDFDEEIIWWNQSELSLLQSSEPMWKEYFDYVDKQYVLNNFTEDSNREFFNE